MKTIRQDDAKRRMQHLYCFLLSWRKFGPSLETWAKLVSLRWIGKYSASDVKLQVWAQDQLDVWREQYVTYIELFDGCQNVFLLLTFPLSSFSLVKTWSNRDAFPKYICHIGKSTTTIYKCFQRWSIHSVTKSSRPCNQPWPSEVISYSLLL